MISSAKQKLQWFLLVRDRETRLWKGVTTSSVNDARRRLATDKPPIIVLSKLTSDNDLAKSIVDLVNAITPGTGVVNVDLKTNEYYLESDWSLIEDLCGEQVQCQWLLKKSEKAEKEEDEALERARLIFEASQKKEIAAFTSKKIWPRFWISNKTKITGLSGCLFVLILCAPITSGLLIISRIPVALALIIILSVLFFLLIRDHREDKERISSIKSRIDRKF